MINDTCRGSEDDAAASLQTFRRAGTYYFGHMRVSRICVGMQVLPRAGRVRPHGKVTRQVAATLGTRCGVAVGDVERDAEGDFRTGVDGRRRGAVGHRGGEALAIRRDELAQAL